MKKTLFLFAAIFACTLLTFAHDFEVDGIYYQVGYLASEVQVPYVTVTYKGNSYEEYKEYSGSVTIPATVNYDGISYSVTGIGWGAFLGCSDLTKISLPNSIIEIEQDAFADCSGLTRITIPESIISIGTQAFQNCTSLTTVIWNAKNCTSGFFNSNTSEQITSFTFGEKVDSIPEGLCKNMSISTITIPKSVSYIGKGAFSACPTIESIIVETGNQTYYSNNTNSIVERETKILIAGCKNSHITGVTTIGAEAFCGCSELKRITIPTGVTTICSSAFEGCSGLTSLTLPASITTIGNSAFYGCSGLRSITVPNNVTTIDKYAFYNCSSLDEVVMGNRITSIGLGAFYSCSGLRSITIPNSVTTIDKYAFAKCSNLTDLSIGNGITSIDTAAFKNCSKLTKIKCLAITPPTIEETTFENVNRNIPVHVPKGSVYEYTISPYWDEFIDIQEDTSRITKFETNGIYYNVLGADSVAVTYQGNSIESPLKYNGSITIPAKVEYNNITYRVVSIGECAFFDCSDLTDITISNGITTIGASAFYACYNLTKIAIPQSVTTISSGAFFGCLYFTEITIPKNVISIGEGAFAFCPTMETLTVEAGNPVYHSAENCIIETASKTIIAGCRNSIIPTDNSVTKIGSFAFYGSSLAEISIPNSVTLIDYGGFAGCSNLSKITCLAVVPPVLDGTSFSDVNRDIPVYVPQAGLASYQNDIYWSSFFSNIQAIEGSTDVDIIHTDDAIGTHKILENGAIYILRNGEKYTIDGRRVM